jgi:hypothetical protein
MGQAQGRSAEALARYREALAIAHDLRSPELEREVRANIPAAGESA